MIGGAADSTGKIFFSMLALCVDSQFCFATIMFFHNIIRVNFLAKFLLKLGLVFIEMANSH